MRRSQLSFALATPFAEGDLLATSEPPGYAVESIPVDVAGASSNRAAGGVMWIVSRGFRQAFSEVQ